MSIDSLHTKDREHQKFVESPTRPGKSAVEVLSQDGSPFSIPANSDAFTRECIGNTEVYKFRSGGMSGSILKTITLYYSSPQDPDFVGGEI